MIIDSSDVLNKNILITGQGRSGTSAVASIFRHLGYFMPEAHKRASNEDGELRKLFLSGQASDVIKELHKRAVDRRLVAWKEPKLFSFRGREVAKEIGSDWRIIIIFRDPYSIALRNSKAMGVNLDDALSDASESNKKLVEFYLDVKNYTQCYLLSYEKLMLNTEMTVAELLNYLGFKASDDLVDYIISEMNKDKKRYLSIVNK